jgi:hypothetical protein
VANSNIIVPTANWPAANLRLTGFSLIGFTQGNDRIMENKMNKIMALGPV